MIALEYIKRYHEKHSVVLWINAASFDRAVESYSQCASAINARYPTIPASSGTATDIQLVHRWLTANKQNPWLLVVDSIDNLEAFDCRDLVPHNNQGTVIVTSTQSQTAKSLDFLGLEISGLDEAAGCEMFLASQDISHYPEERMYTSIYDSHYTKPSKKASRLRGVSLKRSMVYLSLLNKQEQV